MISPETAGQYIIGHLFTDYQAEFCFKTWYLNNYFYVVDLGLMPRERAMRILANALSVYTGLMRPIEDLFSCTTIICAPQIYHVAGLRCDMMGSQVHEEQKKQRVRNAWLLRLQSTSAILALTTPRDRPAHGIKSSTCRQSTIN